MIELYLNGVKCPVRTGQEVAGSYQISAFADISTSSGNRSTRFDISATTEVLTALGNPHILVNASTIPKSKIEARLYVDGLDMKIEYAKILRATDERVEVYLFGGSSDFFSLLKGQNLNDLDLSDLDHTFDDTTIQAALQATSGYIYPIIDYGNMTSASNRIRLDQGQIFPAVFCSTILDEIVTQFGYTLSGDLHEDADFLTLILPFIYEKPQLPPSYFNGSGFLATNITDQAIGAGVTDYVDLPLEISDPSSVYTNDGVKYCFIAPADGYYRFRLKVVTGYSLYWNEQLLRVRLDPVSGGADSTLREYGAADIEGSGITGEYGFFQTDTDFFNLTAGDKVYLEWENPTAASVSILSGYDASGNPRSYFQLLAAEEIELGYGDKWFVAANLPRIACTDFIRFLAYEFACLITADGTSKTLSFTAFSTILDRVDEGTYKDWSEKLDLSDPPEVGYDLKGFAQRNLLRWSKDDTVGDIRGADYDFIIEDESLDGEKTLYTAPFAASGRQVRLSQAISVTEIRVYEEDLSAGGYKKTARTPRVLVNRNETIGTAIDFRVGSTTSFSTANVSRPYFVDLGEDFSLGWSINASTDRIKEYLDYISGYREYRALVLLSPADIAALELTYPVWIEKAGGYLLPLSVENFRYTSRESSIVTFALLPLRT